MAKKSQNLGDADPQNAPTPQAPVKGKTGKQAVNVLGRMVQALNVDSCVSVSWTDPDGTVVIEAICDLPDDLKNYLYNSAFGSPFGSVGGIGGGVNKPNVQLDRVEARLQRGEDLANLLTHPPSNFSAASQAIAQAIADKLSAINFLGKAVVLGVFTILATSDSPETAFTGTATDLPGYAEALGSLNAIAKNRICTEIDLGIVSGLPADEDRWWKAIAKQLQCP